MCWSHCQKCKKGHLQMSYLQSLHTEEVDTAWIQLEDQQVNQEAQLLPPPTIPAATTSTTIPVSTLAPPNTALGESSSSLVTMQHDHCLCPVDGSCDICHTAHPMAVATKAELDSLLQRILDLEVRLKTENKSLRLQVLALEEQMTTWKVKLLC